jgi:hypothetical protein
MPTYVTPGVYYERMDAEAPTVAPLRTDVAAFVGIARRGPLDAALPVNSWKQFVSLYGDFTGAGYLAYAVRGFFENGGRRCWIARVASPLAAAARLELSGQPQTGGPPPAIRTWSIRAWSAGVWGNDLDVDVRETHRAQALADPAASTPDYVTVTSVAGFERGTHVRAYVAPDMQYRVVSAVDVARRRLYFVNPDIRNRLAYERQLSGYDASSPLRIDSIEYTLLVRERGRVVFTAQGFSLMPAHARYGPNLLPPFRTPDEGFSQTGSTAGAQLRDGNAAVRDQPADDAPVPVCIADQRSDAEIALLWPLSQAALVRQPLAGGLDGLALLGTRDFTGESPSVFDDSATRARKQRGLRTLEPVGEVALVAIPDILVRPIAPPIERVPEPCIPDPCLPQPPLPPAVPRPRPVGDLPPRFSDAEIFEVQSALVEHCERVGERFAIIDPPGPASGDPRLGVSPLRAWRRRFDTTFAALYAPWLLAPDPLGQGTATLRAIPPSGHVCGFVARTDLAVGVHRAPANGALHWVQGTTMEIDDALQGVLNPEHVNAIRVFPGRGLRIFGARTLSSDPDWRFVNVRRLLLMLEKAMRIGTQWAVFEPHHALTRAKLRLALTSLLLEMWRRGALSGRIADEAFFVRCGEADNPPDARARGMLVAQVGVAPAKPFEFVVVRVRISENSLEIDDTGRREGIA